MMNTEKKQYCMDLHTHTLASGHAYNTMNEMIRQASQIGLPLLGISDHAPAMPGSTNRYYFQNMVILDREKYGVKLLYGAELNILDYKGTTDLEERDYRDLDYCISSLHTTCMTPGSRQENTYSLIKSMEHPKVMIIGHPDDGHFPLDYEEVVRAAKDAHVLIELNSASFSPKGFRIRAYENDLCILKYCMKYDTPIILGSDAHREEDIGNFDPSEKVRQEVEFPEELIINRSIEALQTYLP